MWFVSRFFPTYVSEAAWIKRRDIPLLSLWAPIACEIDFSLEMLHMRITLIKVKYIIMTGTSYDLMDTQVEITRILRTNELRKWTLLAVVSWKNEEIFV